MNTYDSFLLEAIKASIISGKKIMEIYDSDSFRVELKEDNSPLTLADKKSHKEIKDVLSKFNIPVLSEEGKFVDFTVRKDWDKLWIIDPLDGTKEFIKRNGEFTVNIALVENNEPVLGVIYSPVLQRLYFGLKNRGAYRFIGSEIHESIEKYISLSAKLPLTKTKTYTIVASRSHMSDETKAFIEQKKAYKQHVEFVSMGSSLKICLVAEGTADCYPRFAPTMEWDTAAGQAIAESAGKTFIDYKTGKSMRYNKEILLNNCFVVE